MQPERMTIRLLLDLEVPAGAAVRVIGAAVQPVRAPPKTRRAPEVRRLSAEEIWLRQVEGGKRGAAVLRAKRERITGRQA
jgi:hypothetical protein